MKTLLLAFFALSASAHAADGVTLTCRGSNLVLDKITSIEWTQSKITILGTMGDKPYSVEGSYTRTYSGNGFAYSTVYGEVIIPFAIINGSRAEGDVELSNNDYRETQTCGLAK